MFKKKLLTLAASSILMTAVAGCASNQESDAEVVDVAANSSSSSSSSMASSSSSAYSLHSAEMLNKKRETVYFDFDSAKTIYVELMKIYNGLVEEKQVIVYEDLKELYDERKDAEKLFKKK